MMILYFVNKFASTQDFGTFSIHTKPLLNAGEDISIWANVPKLDLRLNFHICYACKMQDARSKGSGETAHARRLVWAFAAHHFNKHPKSCVLP